LFDVPEEDPVMRFSDGDKASGMASKEILFVG
jgi:hypothetical protein